MHGDPRGPRPRSIEDTIAEFVESVIGVVLRIAWGIVRRPMLSVPMAGMAALSSWTSPEQATGWAIFVAIALLVWRRAHRRSFSWAPAGAPAPAGAGSGSTSFAGGRS